jgi:predicted AAA+ superfamily ATPase
MSLKPWREIAVPHDDVLKGTFQQSEFAADLSRVHDGTATKEYVDPILFFERTYITEGMRLLLDSVLRRIAGKGGDPVIQLQTAFGGGKTHTMLAVYHIASRKADPSKLLGVSKIMDATGIHDLPEAKIAVIDGIQISPNQPKKIGKCLIHTMWGELAYQLGKEDGYAKVAESDKRGVSPGKEILIDLLSAHAPCVILMDELVAYLRQFDDGAKLTGGTFDSNLTFVQALTEAMKAVPNAILLASLPDSHNAGGVQGQKALRELESYFGRVQAIWKPVATEEAFEIVRRRLFSQINDKLAAETTCRAFADYYIANATDLPAETQVAHYYQRLVSAYPIHPEVFERLYEDWSSLENFQRTRGVLKLMAKVIHRLWKDGNNDLMIQPGSLPLYDGDTSNEILCYLPQGWNPVISKDIDGEMAEAKSIDTADTRFGAVQASCRSARTIFLGSAPTTSNKMAQGLELERIILGSVQPGQQIATYKDALRRLQDRLAFLNTANNRYWFDTRPNLRREMEDRKRRFQDDEVVPEIKERVSRSFANGIFAGVHVFTKSADIPDDFALRLVVLNTRSGFSRSSPNVAYEQAVEILKHRGDQPRQRQNRLIFLAADADTVMRLKDQIRTVLAWNSIVVDYRENRIVLDNLQATSAGRSLDEAQEMLRRLIRETFKWLLSPHQEVKPGKGPGEIEWDVHPVSATAPNFTQEIERVLKENELLITAWAPIHLSNLLTTWYWKDGADANALDVWRGTCCYLYMPRLQNDDVYRNAIAAGTGSKDFFGVAYGHQDGKYQGLTFGKSTTPILDATLILIKPSAVPATEPEVPPPQPPGTPGGQGDGPKPLGPKGDEPVPPDAPKPQGKAAKHFYGVVELDPIKAKMDFATIVDEVVQNFTTKTGTTVKIVIEIQADSTSGFDDGLQRSVRENCKVLKFKNSEFESE